MATGMVMGLASRSRRCLSQYSRAAEIPVLVSQYRVMLSQQVVAGEVALQGPLEDLGDQAGLAGPIAVIEL